MHPAVQNVACVPMPDPVLGEKMCAYVILRSGATADYHAIEIVDGEPHLVRGPMGMPGTPAEPAPGRPLLCLAHVTDLQIADVQSPTRFEFLNRLFADPRYAQIVPVQRPQEALTVHAINATVRTLNTVCCPATGQPPEVAVTTDRHHRPDLNA